MTGVTNWWGASVLVAGLALASLTAPAHASDDFRRVAVSPHDVVMHHGHAYYRHHDGYGQGERLYVRYDHHGRPTFYRVVARTRDQHYDHHYARQSHDRRGEHDYAAASHHRGEDRHRDRRRDREHDRRHESRHDRHD